MGTVRQDVTRKARAHADRVYPAELLHDIASVENSAIALALEKEKKSSDAIVEISAALLHSPMFRAIAMEYGLDPKAVEAIAMTRGLSREDFDQACDNSMDLRFLCARMFLAGRYAERLNPKTSDFSKS